LGDFTANPPADYAEEAFLKSRDKAVLRLAGLEMDGEDEDFEQKLSDAVRARLETDFPSWPDKARKHLLTRKLRLALSHPTGGWVVTTKQRLGQFTPEFLDDKASTESPYRREVTLNEHSRG